MSNFTLFEKWKWNKDDWKSRLRSESEMKKLRDREVKFLENSREILRNQKSLRSANFNSGMLKNGKNCEKSWVFVVWVADSCIAILGNIRQYWAWNI